MIKKLFTPAKKNEIRRNIVAGGTFFPNYAYSQGFYLAAKYLAEHNLKEEPVGMLFYPMCFNYRHYIELELKNSIIAAEEVYSIFKKIGQPYGELEKSVKPQLDKTHSLERLLMWLVERLALVSTEEFDEDISKIIIEFHNMDTNGQTFRYPFKKDRGLTLPDKQHYDLQNIQTQMETVKKYLSGIYMRLDENIEIGFEYLQELRDEFSDAEAGFY